MNFYKHHLGDYAAATSHLTWDEDCAYRRLIDQYYKREAAIPAAIKDAVRLARATTPAQKRAVESVLQEFFDLRDDGWHQKRCDEEIGQASAQAETNRRIAEEREARKRARLANESLHAASNESSTNRSPATSGEREPSQTPDSTSQTPDLKDPGRAKAAALAPPGPPPEANGHQPTPAGAICRAMKAAGLQAVNPGDPRLLELIRQGATTAEFEGLAAEAVEKGKGFAWVLTVLQARRKEAGEIALTPKADVRSTTVPSAETVEQYQARMAEERAASREGITKPPAAALALAGKLRVP